MVSILSTRCFLFYFTTLHLIGTLLCRCLISRYFVSKRPAQAFYFTMPGFATIECRVRLISLRSDVTTSAPYLAIIFYQARLLKSLWRGSFSLRNDKSILKCHFCAFADKILPSFQSELCHYRQAWMPRHFFDLRRQNRAFKFKIPRSAHSLYRIGKRRVRLYI